MQQRVEAEHQQRVQDLVDQVGRLLRARGERMTGPRKAVLAVLAASGGHLGAEEVVTRVTDVDPGGDVHVHAQCNACGRLVDLPPDVLEGAGRRMRQEAGFLLDPTHVALSGTCASCAAQGTRTA